MRRVASIVVLASWVVGQIALSAQPASAASDVTDRWFVDTELLHTIRTTWTAGAIALATIAVINRVVQARRRQSYMSSQAAKAHHNPLARRFT